jgi:hypothetical protein
MPKQWGERVSDSIVKLKDTGGGCYRNEFTSKVTFKYFLPCSSYKTDVRELLHFLFSKEGDEADIHLFKVQHGKDHFLGEFRIVKRHLDHSKMERYVLLHRKKEQKVRYPSSSKKRSRSEDMHGEVLSSIFPDLCIKHEPECSSGLSRPCVSKGVHQGWSSEFYTVDYVTYDVGKGIRLCWESKCCREDLDEVAMEKCRTLRDKGLHRVLAIVGHGEGSFVYDFGSSSQTEREYSLSTEMEEIKSVLLK